MPRSHIDHPVVTASSLATGVEYVGVAKGAGDAMALADCLTASDHDVPAALAAYERERLPVGAAVVAHGRVLGAYLQGSDSEEAKRHHTPYAVMSEIAVTRA